MGWVPVGSSPSQLAVGWRLCSALPMAAARHISQMASKHAVLYLPYRAPQTGLCRQALLVLKHYGYM